MVWHKTACVLCSCNCGVEVRLDDRRITRVKGNKAHVGSKGYTCEKALRIDHYQNAVDRLTSPLRRRADGSYEEVDWDTAIAEVAARLAEVRDTHGGDKILYYGGGGQGNHLLGAYGAATRRALGITRRSNALAQEKTGEAWVDGRMVGTHTTPDFHHAEVGLFLGKNPWHSHGIPEARRTIKAMSADPERALIVIDPRRTETADLADHFLQVIPGTDAFCIAALGAVIVQEGRTADGWLADNTVGSEAVVAALTEVPIADYAARCGIDEEQLRDTARRIADASSFTILEDLGVEMAPNSTLVSYLQKLLWALTGNFAKEGGVNTHSSFIPLFSYGTAGNEPRDPVTDSQIISGLMQCNEIASSVLTDHPERLRAMFIESANPGPLTRRFARIPPGDARTRLLGRDRRGLHRDRPRGRLRATRLEPVREGRDHLLRRRVSRQRDVRSSAAPRTARGHPRRTRDPCTLDPGARRLHRRRHRAAESRSRRRPSSWAAALAEAGAERPELAGVAPVIMYETLGPTLPEGTAGAAPLWFSAQQCAMRYPDAVRAAGFEGDGQSLGDALFDALLTNDDGVVFTRHEHDDAWSLVRTPEQKIQLEIGELLDDLRDLADRPATYTTADYPFVLAAGERRSFTANTIVRDPAWRKIDADGSLRMNPTDADELGVDDGSRVRVVTKSGAAEAVVETTDTLQRRHITLPNGMGLDYPGDDNEAKATGVSPNELTAQDWRDHIAGTPWHKHVPARVEPIPA